MKNYSVFIPEVHYKEIVVGADSYEKALKLVLNGEGEMEDLVYSHPIDSDKYEVIDEEGVMKWVDKPSNT